MKRALILAVVLLLGCFSPYDGFPVSDHLAVPPTEVLGKRIKRSFEGQVVSITDGDLIIILDEQEKQVKVRLDSIDSPEKDQPYGSASKAAMQAMADEKHVHVWVTGEDRFGQTLAFVRVPGHIGRIGETIQKRVTLNEQMVQQGFAWHDVQDSKSDELAEAQKKARTNKLGLWSGDGPEDQIPPWEWQQR